MAESNKGRNDKLERHVSNINSHKCGNLEKYLDLTLLRLGGVVPAPVGRHRNAIHGHFGKIYVD